MLQACQSVLGRELDPPVLAALRLGAYQLGYLGGVPRYAAVNESVELVRRARQRLPLEAPIGPLASRPLATIGTGEVLFQALIDMTERQIERVEDVAVPAAEQRGIHELRSSRIEPRDERNERACAARVGEGRGEIA